MRAPAWSCLLAGLSAACSWGRFDDISDNAPVVVLEKPGAMRAGFGVSMASVTLDEETRLLVMGAAGSSRAALFDLGQGDDPHTDALTSGFCISDDAPCELGSSAAGIPTLEDPDGGQHDLCFALGVANPVVTGPGLMVECEDRTAYTIRVPVALRNLLDFTPGSVGPGTVAIAGDGAESPSVVVGAPEAEVMFFYPDVSSDPVELTPPESPGEDFGTRVAATRIGDVRMYAISAPDASTVVLFTDDGSGAPEYLGCLSGGDGLGTSLSFGPITRGDSEPELVVSDDEQVYVLEAEALLDLGGGDALDCVSPDDSGALYATVSCETQGGVTGCEDSLFGAALAVGDIDGDGDGELVVGAPRMKVRDVSRGGAVLIYDLDSGGDDEVSQAAFVSSAEAGDQLGGALTTAALEDRDLIVAGAPSGGKVALFYCPHLLSEKGGGSRCD